MPVKLEERAEEFVTQSCGGKVNVDWEALAELHRRRVYGQTSSTAIIDNILEFLKEKKVLVYENTPGSYYAIGCNLSLHPKRSDSSIGLSFVDEENARAYYSHFYQNALYGLTLVKTIGHIQKAKPTE